MALNYREQLILAKTEAAVGVAEALGAADALLCGNVDLTPLAGERKERANIQPYRGAKKQITTRRHARLRFSVEMAGSGDADTAPAWGRLLTACFMSEAVTATGADPATAPGDVTYSLAVPAAPKSLTMSVNIAGVRQILAGCRGTYSMALESGEVPVLRFDFVGSYADPADAALTANPVFTDFKDPVFASRVNTPDASIFGVDVVLHSIEIDYGATVTWRDLIGGIASARLGDRVVAGRLTIDAPKVAALALVKKAADSESGALAITHGVGAGKIIKLAAPALQLDEPSYGESEGIWTIQSGFRLLPTAAGNDDFTILTQ